MKKLSLILSVAMVLAACSKKENKPALTPKTATAADIMGSWQLTVDTLYTPDPSGKLQPIPDDETSLNEILNYGANGAGTILLNNKPAGSFGWTLSNGVLTNSPTGTNAEVNTILTITTSRMLLRQQESVGYKDVVLIKQ